MRRLRLSMPGLSFHGIALRLLTFHIRSDQRLQPFVIYMFSQDIHRVCSVLNGLPFGGVGVSGRNAPSGFFFASFVTFVRPLFVHTVFAHRALDCPGNHRLGTVPPPRGPALRS